MFLTFLKSSNSYQIIYNNISSGKRNRKNTGTDDHVKADNIMKQFEIEYNKQLLIHNSQLVYNSNANNLLIIQEPIKTENEELTFRDTLQTMLNYYNNQNNNNRNVQLDIRRYYASVIDIIGNKKLSEYKMLDFENYKAKRLTQVSPGTVNCELRNLKAYFNRLIDFELGLIIKNPLNKVKFVDNFNVRLEFKNDEMKKILNEVIQTKNGLMYYSINIAYLTGLRLSELINLKWSDINLAEGVIYVKNKFDEGFTTKSGKERFIPVEKSLLPVLLELKAKDRHNNYVICKTNGYKYHSDFLSLQFRIVLKKLKLNTKHSWHSLRHTMATYYLAAGGNIYNLQSILGHSKITVTEIYAHKNLQTMKTEMSKLSLAV